MAVISLLLLLLPLLLVTTAAQKRVGLDLKISSQEGAGAPQMGPLERLALHVGEVGLEIRASIRKSDVTAALGDTEERRITLPHDSQGPDLAALQAALREMKRLDPTRERIELLPTDDVTAGTLMAILDAVRGDGAGPLFPQPLLGAAP